MRIITSGGNELVKLARRLCDKRGRDKENAFLIEGATLLAEALRCGAVVRTVIIRADAGTESPLTEEGGAERIFPGGSAPADVETVLMSEALFDEIADTVTPQPVMAIMERGNLYRKNRGPLAEVFGPNPALVVLDRLQDPGNVGTILRTADAAGFTGAIALKGTVDILSRKVIRSASGAIFRLPVVKADTPAEVFEMLQALDTRSLACHMEGEVSCYEANLRGAVALILGNEGNGLSTEMADGADVRGYVPMAPGAESLNAAIAAAIFMFEKRRQDAE